MTQVVAPCPGTLVPLAAVPDPVFSSEMLGPGVAIDPAGEEITVVSPVAGKLVKLHPHAFVVLGDDGVGILVHLGINTVKLEGRGFDLLSQEGVQLEQGTPVVRWTPAPAEAEGMSTVVPVVAMDRPKGSVPEPDASSVEAGDPLFEIGP